MKKVKQMYLVMKLAYLDQTVSFHSSVVAPLRSPLRLLLFLSFCFFSTRARTFHPFARLLDHDFQQFQTRLLPLPEHIIYVFSSTGINTELKESFRLELLTPNSSTMAATLGVMLSFLPRFLGGGAFLPTSSSRSSCSS